MHSSVLSEVIVRLDHSKLMPGILGKLFLGGTRAVIIDGDPRVTKIWDAYSKMGEQQPSFNRTENLTHENAIINLARNHCPGDQRVGDMLRFVPGSISHIARKMKLLRVDNNASLKVVPQVFWENGKAVQLPEEVLESVWSIMEELFIATLPDDYQPAPYAASLERLKYVSNVELDQIYSLLRDSGGRWTARAQKLDAIMAVANGPFARRGLIELFACGSMIPCIGHLLRSLNQIFANSAQENSPPNSVCVGKPHVDQTKAITALASDRDLLKTQVFDGHDWHDLPLTTHSLAIIPSGKLDPNLGIKPTLHRVLLAQEKGQQESKTSNITIAMTIGQRPRLDE